MTIKKGSAFGYVVPTAERQVKLLVHAIHEADSSVGANVFAAPRYWLRAWLDLGDVLQQPPGTPPPPPPPPQRKKEQLKERDCFWIKAVLKDACVKVSASL